MPPFRSLFVIILLSAAPPMERIMNKDNYGHMISSAQACIRAKHAKAAGVLLARHFPPSQGTELFAASLFFLGWEKALKVERSPNCGEMHNALRSLFFGYRQAGSIAHGPAPLPEVAMW